MTPEKGVFNKMVEAYRATRVWSGSYAHGLFDAFVALTGRDADGESR